MHNDQFGRIRSTMISLFLPLFVTVLIEAPLQASLAKLIEESFWKWLLVIVVGILVYLLLFVSVYWACHLIFESRKFLPQGPKTPSKSVETLRNEFNTVVIDGIVKAEMHCEKMKDAEENQVEVCFHFCEALFCLREAVDCADKLKQAIDNVKGISQSYGNQGADFLRIIAAVQKMKKVYNCLYNAKIRYHEDDEKSKSVQGVAEEQLSLICQCLKKFD